MTGDNPVLVTGAAGFIGQRLAMELRRADTPVRALARPEHDVADLRVAGVETFLGDATDGPLMARAADGCSVVYHLAAVRGTKKLPRKDYLRLNIDLLDVAAEAASAAGARLVAASTVKVMSGWPPATPALSVPPRPSSNYSASRAAAERRLTEHWAPKGLDFRIARIAERVAGPGAIDWRSIVCAVRDGRYRLLPRGGGVHSCDVEDVIIGLQLCAGDKARAGETYVLTARKPAAVDRILAAIATTLGANLAPLRFPGGPIRFHKRLNDMTFRLVGRELPYGFTAEFYAWPNHFDVGGTVERLGFSPRFSVTQAVTRATQWMQREGLV
ncbi:NAD-dependent epimerase/dehydratase family protein [Tropicimonas marinistellae]|uniref:NAD-dependent epimerase/dehydratase family protein n=1 Tax=Tropicimonas marinistellae TaxID=1739787 RepID=UPI000833895A|nr:NAD-dependent epimerase/dehydratase family protein [Tropicimonas marinistellae]